MWIRNKYLQLKSRIFYRFFSTYRPQDGTYRSTIGQVLCLESKLFENLDIGKACVYEIECDYPNLVDFILSLRMLNDSLMVKAKVQKEWLPTQRFHMSVEQLFIDKNARVFDAATCVADFKHEATSFINRYLEIEHAKIGIDGYNYRSLSKTLQSVLELSRHLRNYTNE